MNPKDLVLTALDEVFGHRDLDAVGRYFSPGYVQHSTLAAPGPDGLRALAGTLPEGFRYDLVRVLADGDLVVTHGVYHGFGEQPLIAFDLWRVADGQIVEHWDALQPEVTATASGRSMTDGPTAVTEPARTEANRALVQRFVQQVLVSGDLSELAGYYDQKGTYAQHNPGIADDLSGLGAALGALAEQGLAIVYTVVHNVVAEGEFVFVQSEGTFGPTPTAFYDLFRVQEGKLAEHWDVVFPVPGTMPHDNGLF